MNNVDSFKLSNCIFAGSTTFGATSEWISLINITGIVESNSFNANGNAGTLLGMLNIVGNSIAATTGFNLTGGVISTNNNEISAGTSGFMVAPASPLTINLGPDLFKSAVTNSYYITPDSADISGRINYDSNSDSSIAKFTNATSRVSVTNIDSKQFTVSTTPYTILKTDTGRTILATGSTTQTFTLPTPTPGTKVQIAKMGTAGLIINCAASSNFYNGGASAPTTATATATEIGAHIELTAYATVGWIVTGISGTWTFT